MNNLFTYLLQSSFALLLFYAIYLIFLRKETYYAANRYYLMFGLFCAVLMPMVPIHYTVNVASAPVINIFKEITGDIKGIQAYTGEAFNVSDPFNWQKAIRLIYLSGALIIFMRLLVQTFMLYLHSDTKKVKYIEGLKVFESDKYSMPFSFFNLVYINPKFHKQEVLPQILAHEKVHIRERHWIDLLIIELLTVIFWFNPIIWFFEHSIKLNHEYLADQGVISNGSNLGRYQALLINQLMGMQIVGITHNLNFGINTNRLKMMTKQKTPKFKIIKLAWAMPVLAILLYAFAEPIYKIRTSDQHQVSGIEQQEKNITFEGTVMDQDGYAIPGVSIIIKGSTIGTVTDVDGTFKLKAAEKDNIIFSYIGKESLTLTIDDIFFKNNEIVMFNKALVLNAVKMLLEDDQLATPKVNETKTIPPPPPPSPKNLKDEVIEEPIFIVVEQMPEYPGGLKALGNYILDMQKSLARSENIKGKARVGFTIDVKGKATNIKILEQDNEAVGKGAATILMNMKDWTPGKQRNKPVPVDYILPVEFK